VVNSEIRAHFVTKSHKSQIMIETDILIIGAGPVGLFTVFEAGLIKLRCHLIDALGQPGGQLTEIYPKKPIYDIPGYPKVLAGELVDNLMEQIKPFNPGFTLGERAEEIKELEDGRFEVITTRGTVHRAPVIAIAGGLGCFEPRKPPLKNLAEFEDNGVDYIIREPEKFRDKKIVIAGGGDSALDWSIELANVAERVTLVHRREEFRGALDSVEKVHDLAKQGKVDMFTNSQVTEISGNGHLNKVNITNKQKEVTEVEADYFLPLFGLSPKLGPIAKWNLALNGNAIKVDPSDYSTSVPGIYAIGDINDYPGKLKLILCGFHEGTLMVQSAFKRIYPDKRLSFKYTTVNGVGTLEN
jgi:thioredoxin reductase (NADPH)